MPSKKEMEAKIKSLDFIIKHMTERVESCIAVSKEREASGEVISDFERGMRYQSEFLQKSFIAVMDAGLTLEEDLISGFHSQ
jgi:hypothetical protein